MSLHSAFQKPKILLLKLLILREGGCPPTPCPDPAGRRAGYRPAAKGGGGSRQSHHTCSLLPPHQPRAGLPALPELYRPSFPGLPVSRPLPPQTLTHSSCCSASLTPGRSFEQSRVRVVRAPACLGFPLAEAVPSPSGKDPPVAGLLEDRLESTKRD